MEEDQGGADPSAHAHYSLGGSDSAVYVVVCVWQERTHPFTYQPYLLSAYLYCIYTVGCVGGGLHCDTILILTFWDILFLPFEELLHFSVPWLLHCTLFQMRCLFAFS